MVAPLSQAGIGCLTLCVPASLSACLTLRLPCCLAAWLAGVQVMICVTAPAVRVAIGEEVGLAPGSITTGQMVTAQRQLGFRFVFDVNFAGEF